MAENTRVRFGRVGEHRAPKNTLVTMRKDETVYFGISRCRAMVDRFTKEEGVKRATARANAASKNPSCEWSVDGDFMIHRTGLFGQVSVAEIKKLLAYFDNVDEVHREAAKLAKKSQ